MIRFVHCIKARADISESEFRVAFNSKQMESLAEKMAILSGAKSYKLSLTMKIEVNAELMEERSGQEPYDGMIEFWWDSGKALEALRHSDDFKTFQKEIMEYQQTFIDFEKSSRFFTEA